MNYLSPMTKREEDKRIEAHLNPEEFAQFSAIAKAKQWSNKKLAENIIREYLKKSKSKGKD